MNNELSERLENIGQGQYKNPPAGNGCYWLHEPGKMYLMKDGRVLGIYYFDEKKVPPANHVPKPD